MQNVSALYNSIMNSGGEQECKLDINNVPYEMDTLVEMQTSIALYDKLSVGNTMAGTIDVSLFTPSSAVPVMAQLRPYVRAVKRPHYGRNQIIDNRTYPYEAVNSSGVAQGITVSRTADGAYLLNGTSSVVSRVYNLGNPNATASANEADQVKWLATGSYKMTITADNLPEGAIVRVYVYRYTSTAANPTRTQLAYAEAGGSEVSFSVTDAYTYILLNLYIGAGTYSNCKIYPLVWLASDTSTNWDEPAQSITLASEWLPKGVYWIDTREYDKESGILALHGYDAMLKGEQDYMVEGDQGIWPRKDRNVLCDLADLLELGTDVYTSVTATGNPRAAGLYERVNNKYEPTLDTSVVSGKVYYQRTNTGIDSRVWDIVTNNYDVQYTGFGEEGYTVREVLGYIGSMYAGNWIINEQGQLRLVVLGDIPAETSYLITENDLRIVIGGDRLIMI